MTVITKFVVEHKGKELFVTTDRKAADAYDKMLDTAEQLSQLIATHSGVTIGEKELEELTIFLSKNRESVTTLLKGKSLSDIAADILPADSASS